MPIAYDNYVDWVSTDGDKIYESSFSIGFDAELSYNLSLFTDIRSTITEIVSLNGKEEGMVVLLSNGDMLLGLRSAERRLSFFPLSVFFGDSVAAGNIVKGIYIHSSSEGDVIGMNIVTPDSEYKIIEMKVETFFRYDFLFSRSELFTTREEFNELITTFANGIKPSYLDDSFSNSIAVSTYGDTMAIQESDDSSYDIKVTSNTGTSLSGKKILFPELGTVIEYKQQITSGGDFYADYLFDECSLDDSILPIRMGEARLGNAFVSFTSFNVSTNSLIDSDAIVMANGSLDSDATITQTGYGYYTVALSDDTFFAHVGVTYSGMATSLPLATSGAGQNGYNRPKSIAELQFRLLNSGDGKVFVNNAPGEEFEFKQIGVWNWKPFKNDVHTIRPQSSWDRKTEITFYQDEPQPLNISMIDVFQETSN